MVYTPVLAHGIASAAHQQEYATVAASLLPPQFLMMSKQPSEEQGTKQKIRGIELLQHLNNCNYTGNLQR